MRRRSERKKSTDVSSPVPPASRRSRRSRKSPSLSETEKSAEVSESQYVPEEIEDAEPNRSVPDSSDECAEQPTRRNRSARKRTPAKERNSPAKRKIQRAESPDVKISAIPEEENGAEVGNVIALSSTGDIATETSNDNEAPVKDDSRQDEENENVEVEKDEKLLDLVTTIDDSPAKSQSPLPKEETADDVEIKASAVRDVQAADEQDECTEAVVDGDKVLRTPSEDRSEESDEPQVSIEIESNDISTTTDVAIESSTDRQSNEQDKTEERQYPVASAAPTTDASQTEAVPNESANRQQTNNGIAHAADNARTRKRKWITKKVIECKAPVLSISSDSLKNLIADVQPVPLSDVQLESSSEVEEVTSEREEGEETPSPERERGRSSIEKIAKSATSLAPHAVGLLNKDMNAKEPLQRSPSPALNQTSSVLYITNLVRPFTVLQLKGLLVRTGKIVENGFWIDRIKSKCYVQYETNDEAIETRHALHGVRWPVSNPKCLNVDFGLRADMEKAIEATKDDGPKFGQDNNKDNVIVGTGWSRERPTDDKRMSKHVREWDVGKKESQEQDKAGVLDKRRSRDRDVANMRENDTSEKDKKNRVRPRNARSSSLSPVRKMKKKENDPPLRLLDDLFRKTKVTPCIYWLPLTPEQIAEKEALRQKAIEDHKERVKLREMERGKEREKERTRGSDREREREQRRNRSSDRRRSRSRERRRY